MRRLLASRGASVAAVGILIALIAGGGYALASGGGGKTITVCVSHHGGTLYKAKRCAKHDKKLTWNKAGQRGAQGIQGQTGGTGPQGPGATTVEYDTTASASPPTATIGTMGPYTLTGTCTSSAGNNTTFNVSFSGSPGLQFDGSATTSTGAFPESSKIAGPISNAFFGRAGPTTTQDIQSATLVLFPTGTAPFEITTTISAAGGTAVPGVAPNTCHFSMIITPATAPAASAALRNKPVARFSGPLLGK